MKQNCLWQPVNQDVSASSGQGRSWVIAEVPGQGSTVHLERAGPFCLLLTWESGQRGFGDESACCWPGAEPFWGWKVKKTPLLLPVPCEFCYGTGWARCTSSSDKRRGPIFSRKPKHCSWRAWAVGLAGLSSLHWRTKELNRSNKSKVLLWAALSLEGGGCKPSIRK